MELVSVRIEKSPQAAGRVRLVGEVAYDDRPDTETYWFEFDEEYAPYLSLSGNPWLACLLPLAATIRQDLKLCVPVDPVQLANAPRIMAYWKDWYRKRYPGLRVAKITADVQPSALSPAPQETGAFFSGGIDSFYTILRNAEAEDRAASPRIDRLIWVGGFDLPIDRPDEEHRRLRAILSTAASELSMRFIGVRTNLRETRFREPDWGHLGHGPALAGVGLTLERLFRTFYIAATHESRTLRPWGSHPDTDPLLSTRSTRFLHDGLVPRSSKTEYISRSDVALRSLHVCFRSGTAENCGDCGKCYLAMLQLELLGALPRCPTFSRRPDLDRVRKVYLRGPTYLRLYREIEMKARVSGREDIAKAIVACRRRSRLMKPMVSALTWLAARRGLWRVARRLRPAVMAGSVR